MKATALLLVLVGCSSPPVTSEPPPEAGTVDAGVDAGPLCCVGPTNPVWGNVTECDQEGSVPWVCSDNDGGTGFACDDPRCQVGSWCDGVTGIGSVESCP